MCAEVDEPDVASDMRSVGTEAVGGGAVELIGLGPVVLGFVGGHGLDRVVHVVPPLILREPMDGVDDDVEHRAASRCGQAGDLVPQLHGHS